MIPRLYRSIRPGVSVPGNPGMASAAAAGVGHALQQAGNAVANFAEQQALRADTLAISRVFRQFDEDRLAYLRSLAERQDELTAIHADGPQGGQTGYDAELTRFATWLNDHRDALGQGLSSRAREAFEVRVNESQPQWVDQFVGTLGHLESQNLAAEMEQLAAADRESEAMELLQTSQEHFTPADRQRITSRIQQLSMEARLKGAMQHLQDIAQQSDWDTALEASADVEFQKFHGLDIAEASQLTARLQTFALQGKARAQTELQNQQEKARDDLNDKLAAGTLAYADIDASPLDETEQRQFYDWMRQDAERRANGPKIITDEFLRHQLKAEALDITRGRIEYSQVLSHAAQAKAAGKLDDEAFKDVLTAARAELSGGQGEAMAAASRSAERQLVSVTESALQQYAQLVAAGNSSAKALLSTAETRRQSEYRLVDLHNSRLRDFLKRQPEAEGDDIYRESRRILLGLRTAGASERNAMLQQWDATIDPTYDMNTRQEIDGGQVSGPPVGLEPIWGDLNNQEQSSVLQLLRAGRTPDEIMDHYRRKAAAQP